jgi:clusterin-associated protein 1
VLRYDPTAEVDENISSEVHRVEFLKSIATVMMSKARVKLNIKQLYRADGYAVKELLKISSLLYDAIHLDVVGGDGDGTDNDSAKNQAAADLSLATKLDELKEARNLATEIVESGSKLFGLLGREAELKESRDRALAFLDSISNNLGSDDPHNQIERNIRDQVALLSENVVELERLREEADKSAKTLKGKIERKHTELERAEKRLKSLKKVKPAFSEEYEQLEGELKNIYETYLERFRNLQYLEFELNKYHTAEMEKKIESDKALKRMQKR